MATVTGWTRSGGASSRRARSHTASRPTWPWCRTPGWKPWALAALDSAEAFAAEFAPDDGVPARAHGSYDALAADPDVDVVYVASPHGLHLDHVRMLLEAGKPVLCEKAITLDAAQAEELVALAREKDLFLMEAMWMACHPLVRHLRERARACDFGALRQLVADLGWVVRKPPTDRMFAPELGGGALLDMGIYPLTLAQLFLGEPAELTAVAHLAETGIDLNLVLAARYDDGAVAAMTTSMTANSPAHRHDRDRHRPVGLPGRVPPPVVRHLDAVRRGPRRWPRSGSSRPSR